MHAPLGSLQLDELLTHGLVERPRKLGALPDPSSMRIGAAAANQLLDHERHSAAASEHGVDRGRRWVSAIDCRKQRGHFATIEPVEADLLHGMLSLEAPDQLASRALAATGRSADRSR